MNNKIFTDRLLTINETTDVVLSTESIKKSIIFSEKEKKCLFLIILDDLGTIIDIIVPKSEYVKENLGEEFFNQISLDTFYLVDIIFYDVFFRVLKTLSSLKINNEKSIADHFENKLAENPHYFKELFNQLKDLIQTQEMI